MRTYLKKLGSVSIVAMAMVTSTAFAEGHHKVTGADYANGKNIFENGKGDVPACQSCHGAKGLGNDSLGTPRLAGQIYAFVYKQLDDFANDRRQDTTMFVMNANAKGLTPQDRKDVAAYVNSLNNSFEGKELSEAHGGSDIAALKENGVQVGTAHLGKALVNFGDISRSIPACRSCHDYNGRGVGPMYPRIGEQKFQYLVNQLNKWRDGTRANDPQGQMRAVAKKLTDEDILNVATYLTQAPQTKPGDTRIPVEHLP
jgi:cytochrome c553